MLVLAAAALLSTLGGCSSRSWIRHSDGTVMMSARADTVQDLQRTTVEHSIPVGDEPVRVRNLAGRIEIVQIDGETIEIEADVQARGHTPEHSLELLEHMQWVQETDRQGRTEWTLDYPLDRHQSFHYSTRGRGYTVVASRFAQRRVEVSTQRSSGTPTLFADLTIRVPAGADLRIRSLAGNVDGGDLAGTLALDIHAGQATFASFEGDLDIDTGGGDIAVESISGRTNLDTGSGEIRVGSLAGDAVLDTGSGDITVSQATSETIHADTGSGSIFIDSGRVRTIHADTGSGDVELRRVDFEQLHGDTGSGDIIIDSPLLDARNIHADTGSGDVIIIAPRDASFNLHTSIGSGRVHVGFTDARILYDHREIIGARRGDGRTFIFVDTGSGDCTIRPSATP
jgi:DUF4097 and DUF4098 domain-containing protein YvlB